LNRYHLSRDANEAEIVAALLKVGASVHRFHVPCDLIVGYRGKTYLLTRALTMSFERLLRPCARSVLSPELKPRVTGACQKANPHRAPAERRAPVHHLGSQSIPTWNRSILIDAGWVLRVPCSPWELRELLKSSRRTAKPS